MPDRRGQGVLQVLGKNLRAERTRRDLSQETLAFDAGLDRTYLSGIERGRRNPSVLSLFKFCNALRIPMVRLFRGVGCP